jgi:hypothetical protein
VLDWTDRPQFSVELLQLVAPVDCRLTARSQWMPQGYRSPDEARLETFGPKVVPETETWSNLRTWWLAHERGANTPNWDIAASCEIDEKPGLILIEAKANLPELSIAGPDSSCLSRVLGRRWHCGCRGAIQQRRSLGGGLRGARKLSRSEGTVRVPNRVWRCTDVVAGSLAPSD